jgi:aryl-alcohol dehydrogenase-like predicted oxidoreductase
MTRQKKRPGGSVLIWNFAERGCARSVSRRAFKMLRLVSDTAALRSNQDTTGQADASLAPMALRWILEFPAVTCAIPGAKRPGQVVWRFLIIIVILIGR